MSRHTSSTQEITYVIFSTYTKNTIKRVLPVKYSIWGLVIFALLCSGAKRWAEGATSTNTSDQLAEAAVELGFIEDFYGFGTRMSAIPMGVVITYALEEGSTGHGNPVLAEIFDQLVISPSNQTQIFDLFQDDDPVDVDLIAEALTNGQPNVFRFARSFAPTPSGGGSSEGPGVEISMPPDSQILFFRLTVAPFSNQWC